MAAETAGIATAIFTVIGTVLGASLKAGGSRAATQRRANGKVYTQIEKMLLDLQAINNAFWKEDERIRAAKRERDVAARARTPEADRPEIPGRVYHLSQDFLDRRAHLWSLVQKAEETVADNVLDLSAGFSRTYWRFYRELLLPGAPEMEQSARHALAEQVVLKWRNTLRRKAEAGFRLRIAFVLLQLLAGIAIGGMIVHYRPFLAAGLPDLSQLTSQLERLL